MNPRVRRVRTGLRIGVGLAAGALTLASCGTSAVAPPAHLSGTPALSFDVPLTNVACTLNDVCVALGTSSSGSGPTSIAEFSTPHGKWLNLALPSGASTLLTTTACSGSQCLIGGSRPGSDLLWLFDSHGHSLSALTPPAQGIGVSSLTCNSLTCAMLDTGPGGVPRFSVSSDDGSTWSTPAPLAFAKGDAVTAFSCGSSLSCALGLMTPAHVFALYVTSNAGSTWNEQATPSSWTTLTSLSCQARRCIGLAATATKSLLMRSTTFTRTWKNTALKFQASSLACTPLQQCVVVGQRSDDSPWLAMVRDKKTTAVNLRYVPSPLLAVACGSKVCAAIGVTTLVSIPSTT
jgi:hypothetical protein